MNERVLHTAQNTSELIKSGKFREITQHEVEPRYQNKTAMKAIEAIGVDPKSLLCFYDQTNGALELRTIDFHHRSVDRKAPSPITIKHRGQEPSVFASFDIKGAGFIRPETHESKKEGIEKGSLAAYPEVYPIRGSTEFEWGYDVLGLMDWRVAQNAIEQTKRFNSAGMRTEEYAAVYSLNTIHVGGESLSLKKFVQRTAEEWRIESGTIPTVTLLKQQAKLKESLVFAKQEDDVARIAEIESILESIREKLALREMAKDMKEGFEPVMAVRLMRSVFRVRDLYDANRPIESKMMLEEALEAYQLEQRLLKTSTESETSPLDIERYATLTVGHWSKNLGIMHREGYKHMYLHMGNLTLAGETVDLDSMEKLERESLGPHYPLYGDLPHSVAKDIRDLLVSVKKFLSALKKHGYQIEDRDAILDSFIKGYQDGLKEAYGIEKVGIAREQILNVIQEQARRAIIEKQELPKLSVY